MNAYAPARLAASVSEWLAYPIVRLGAAEFTVRHGDQVLGLD